ncbi:MAG: hypothetical protein CVU42_01135 [Chloroflexi bacterium HGW-Chloroflexi-4]|jgi:hypothetical protein|nr:MAG: hypothetical protein CVU42_01135 [Chloroflexi bacterium HGW-Chloroflexi-4]
MNSSIIALFETLFDVIYLLLVWGMVILMTVKMTKVNESDRKTANWIRLAFILLAAGDTGHVGFRVLAQVTNTLDKPVIIFGAPMHLVGLGMMTTAFTVTMFYMVFILVWQSRNQQKGTWFTNLLLAFGVVRIIFMALPANLWGDLVPPQPISLYRNLFLIVQGMGLLGLLFYSAAQKKDQLFMAIAWMIVLSFAFYTPVILFAQKIPMIGMLMIPKTIAYLAVAIIAYNGLWKPKRIYK